MLRALMRPQHAHNYVLQGVIVAGIRTCKDIYVIIKAYGFHIAHRVSM